LLSIEGLQPATRAWVEHVLAIYELEQHHERLLFLAAQAWDEAQDARTTIERDGAVYRDRFGSPRPHPSLKIEQDARIAFARLLRDLGLDGEPMVKK